MRFSIAITILVTYLVYFGMAVWWSGGTNQEMVETLTNLMTNIRFGVEFFYRIVERAAQ
jgi:hypothetical protein